MTASTRVAPTEITGAYGTVLKFAARKMMGEVPDSMGVMWNHPAVLKDAFTELERRVMEYAEAASQTPPAVTDDLSAALVAGSFAQSVAPNQSTTTTGSSPTTHAS